MPFVAHSEPVTPSKIYVTRVEGEIDRKTLIANLTDLARRGRITARDEQLMEYLRELNVLSLDQVRRLLFTNAGQRRTYNRLWFLSREYLLSSARTSRADMEHWGLVPGKVYALGPAGRLWLKEEVSDQPARHLKRDQVLHDLLVSELCVWLVEEIRRRGKAWSLIWSGEQAASFYHDEDSPLVAPDGLAVVRHQKPGAAPAYLPFFLEVDASREAHGRPSSDWGRKIHGYDRFISHDWRYHPQLTNLPSFPAVAVVTHGEQRMLNLANAINQHRREEVVYYLALWQDLMESEDILTTPAWVVVTPDGQIVGQDREQRRPLLPTPAKVKK
jgi:hypothetical protein